MRQLLLVIAAFLLFVFSLHAQETLVPQKLAVPSWHNIALGDANQMEGGHHVYATWTAYTSGMKVNRVKLGMLLTILDPAGDGSQPAITYCLTSWTTTSAIPSQSEWTLIGTDDQTAAEVGNTAAGNIEATDVQSAINELDTEKLDKTASFVGDVTGTYGATVVEKLQGTAVSSTAPDTDGQVLKYNSAESKWEPAAVSTTDELVKVYGGTNALPLNASEFTEGTTDITIASDAITSAKIANGTIIDEDVEVTAAIAGTKISPDFGDQNVTTTGDVSGANLAATGTLDVTGTATIGAYTLPNTDGTADQVLATDGSGALSWTDPVALADGTTSGNTLLWNGTDWVESDVLTNDGTDVATSGDFTTLGGDITVGQSNIANAGTIIFEDGSTTLYKVRLVAPTNVSSSSKTITLPDKTGTIALTSDITSLPTGTSYQTLRYDGSAWAATDLLQVGISNVSTSGNLVVNGGKIYVGETTATAQGAISFHDGNSSTSYSGVLAAPTMYTGSQIYTLPDASGTVALTSDITSLPTGTSGQTLRYGASGWEASSVLTNDGTDVATSGNLAVDGGYIYGANDESIKLGGTDGIISLMGDGGTDNQSISFGLDSSVGPSIYSASADTIRMNENVKISNDLIVNGGDVNISSSGDVRIKCEAPGNDVYFDMNNNNNSYRIYKSGGNTLSFQTSTDFSDYTSQVQFSPSGSISALGNLAVDGGYIYGANGESIKLGGTDGIISLMGDGGTDNQSISFGLDSSVGPSIYSASADTIRMNENVKISGNLTVNGGYLTFGNSANINNVTSGYLDLNATTIRGYSNMDLYGDFTAVGGDITVGRSSTAKAGTIVFHDGSSSTTYYGSLVAPSSFSANRTYTLPNATGTLALTSDVDAVLPAGSTNYTMRYNGSAWVATNALTVQSDSRVDLGGLVKVHGDLYFENSEYISNAADGIVAINATTTSTSGDITVSGGKITGANSEYISIGEIDDIIKFQGAGGSDNTDLAFDLDGTYPVIYSPTDTRIEINDDLTVSGNDLTFGNGESIDNNTDGNIDINAATTTATGDLTVSGGDITIGAAATAKAGTIVFHDGSSSTSYYGSLVAPSSFSANRTYTLPNATGTLALTSDITSLPTGTSGQTMRYSTSGWEASSVLTNDGTNVTTSGDITVSGGRVTFGNSEFISNETDDIFRFGGSGGTDNTDLYFDVDGTYPIIYSHADATVGIDDNLYVTADLTVAGNDITFGNAEKISNASDGYIDVTAPTALRTSADLIVTGGDITIGAAATAKAGTIVFHDGSSTSSFYGSLVAPTSAFSANRTITLPNASGTLALTSDITSLPTGTSGQTMRYGTSGWEASSVLTNDGTDVTTSGGLKVSGGIITGSNGEYISIGKTDDYIQFNGLYGTYDTDLRFDLDGAYPIIDSPTGSKVGIGNDLYFINSEYISNATNGYLDLNASYTRTSGDLIVTGNDITFGNAEKISNVYNDIIYFQGSGGTDDTNLYFNLDGEYPTIYSYVDAAVGIDDDLIVSGDQLALGDTDVETPFININFANSSRGGIYFRETLAGVLGTDYDWALYNNGADNSFVIKSSADKGVELSSKSSTSWSGLSDARLKTNIEELKVLEKIDNCRAVSFNWKSDGIHDIGVIAQEMYKVFPEVVDVGEEELGEDNDGAWMVRYAQIAPLAMQGVKELHQKVKTQQTKIDSMQTEIDELKALVKQLLEK